jgi:hypothetical protein
VGSGPGEKKKNFEPPARMNRLKICTVNWEDYS